MNRLDTSGKSTIMTWKRRLWPAGLLWAFVLASPGNAGNVTSRWVTLRPEGPTNDIWRVSLDPMQSANYTVDIARAGTVDNRAYTFETAALTKLTSNLTCFVWTITNTPPPAGIARRHEAHVLNTVWLNGVTEFRVDCSWIPAPPPPAPPGPPGPPGGGTGIGDGDGDWWNRILGWAEGIAIATNSFLEVRVSPTNVVCLRSPQNVLDFTAWLVHNQSNRMAVCDWWLDPADGGAFRSGHTALHNVEVEPLKPGILDVHAATTEGHPPASNSVRVTVYNVALSPPLTNVCWGRTDTVELRLTNSYVQPGGVIWSGTNGLGVTAAGAEYLRFIPGNSLPASYTVRATSVDLPDCWDEAAVNVIKVEIEPETEPGHLICVGGTKDYTAVVTPAEAAALGEFTWKVNNEDKLGFVDDENTGQTVTVTGKQSSASMNAEELTVEFRIDGELICAPSTNLTVINVEMEIHKPKVIDQNETIIPSDDKLTIGSITFVNLDNDDGGAKFDNDPTKAEVGGGDNELVKVLLRLQPEDLNIGQARLLAPQGGDSIAVWANDSKTLTAAYAIGATLNVPADFTVSDDSLVKALWIEGTNAHTIQRQTRLRMEYKFDGLTCTDEASLTVVGIESVKWTGIGNSLANDDDLDECPNWPSNFPAESEIPRSLRVFPCARSDGQGNIGAARDKVKVEVTLSVAPTHDIDIFLRWFDVDDPSAHDNAVDKDGEVDGAKKNDNRGDGVFVYEDVPDEILYGGDRIYKLAFPANDAVKDCKFKLSMYPGDNFRIVANGDKGFLSNLESDDTKQDEGATVEERNENKQRICHKNVAGTPEDREVRQSGNYVSPTLTVWRFLHIEADSMAAPGPDDNIVTGYLTAISIDYTDINVNLRVTLGDYSRNLSDYPSPDNGRFENGWIKIGQGDGIPGQTQTTGLCGNGNQFVKKAAGFDIPFLITKPGHPDVSGNVSSWVHGVVFELDPTSGTLTTNHVGGTINVAGISSTISGVHTGVTWNTVHVEQAPTIPFILHDDDKATHPFNPDLSMLLASDSTNDNIFAAAYIRPTHLGAGASIAPFILNVENIAFTNQVDAGRDYNSFPRYWTAYIQGGFQGRVLADRDPNSEEGHHGSSFMSSKGGMVFVETIRDSEVFHDLSEDELHEKVVAHEIGHQFSLWHNDIGGIMSTNYLSQPYFIPDDISKIRSTWNPAIHRP